MEALPDGVVARTIEQDRVWSPTLGGPSWQEKLEALYQQPAEQGP